MTPDSLRTRVAVALLFSASFSASFSCPDTGALPPRFRGSALAPSGETLLANASSLSLIPRGDSMGPTFCILSTFVNPNRPSEVFITLGNAANAGADVDVACAMLDTFSAPTSVTFNLTTDSDACPLTRGAPYASWAALPRTPPSCPPTAATIPSALLGEGTLTDAQASGNSKLFVDAHSWVGVDQGALVDTRCIAGVSPAPGTTGVTQLHFENGASASGNLPSTSCVWAAPSDAMHLAFKWGTGSTCPRDFVAPAVVPFTFTGCCDGNDTSLYAAWLRGRDGVSYSRAPFEARAAAFEHNTLATVGASPFADLTPAEFKALLSSWGGAAGIAATATSPTTTQQTAAADATAPPPSVDWVAQGKVLPVSAANECGGLSPPFVGAAASALAIMSRQRPVLLPPAQVSSCACGNACGGCELSAAWGWAQAHGLSSSFSGACRYTPSLFITSHVTVDANETALEVALAQQPVLVGINAAPLQLYTSGIFSAPCVDEVDTLALAVGYGIEGGVGFWKLQLAWGTDFGEQGFVRIARGAQWGAAGECGVQSFASYPLVTAARMSVHA